MAEDTNLNATDSNGSASVNSPEDTNKDVSSPSVKQEPSDSLNFKELLSVPKKPEDRDGLSRRQYKEQETRSIIEETVRAELQKHLGGNSETGGQTGPTLEEIEARLEQKFGLSQIQKINEYEEKTKFSETQSQFAKTLETKGINPKDFNATLKAPFEQKFKELIDDGLSVHAASKHALEYVIKDYDKDSLVKDANSRADARAKLKTSPDSNTKDSVGRTITESELSKLSQSEYNVIREKIMRQEITLVKD